MTRRGPTKSTGILRDVRRAINLSCRKMLTAPWPYNYLCNINRGEEDFVNAEIHLSPTAEREAFLTNPLHLPMKLCPKEFEPKSYKLYLRFFEYSKFSTLYSEPQNDYYPVAGSPLHLIFVEPFFASRLCNGLYG